MITRLTWEIHDDIFDPDAKRFRVEWVSDGQEMGYINDHLPAEMLADTLALHAFALSMARKVMAS